MTDGVGVDRCPRGMLARPVRVVTLTYIFSVYSSLLESLPYSCCGAHTLNLLLLFSYQYYNIANGTGVSGPYLCTIRLWSIVLDDNKNREPQENNVLEHTDEHATITATTSILSEKPCVCGILVTLPLRMVSSC